jgi:hypothetical protein
MLPTTCPYLPSESSFTYRAIHPIPVSSKKIVREWSSSRSIKGRELTQEGGLVSAGSV